MKTFINNFIISKYDESFSKRARPTNKIHLWEHLFKFANFYDFRLSFFFSPETRENPIHFYRNWALIKRGRVNDPFEKWRVTTSQWQFLPVHVNTTHTHIPRTAEAGLNGAHAIFILHSIYCACLSIYT